MFELVHHYMSNYHESLITFRSIKYIIAVSVDEVVSDVTKGVIMYNSNNVPLENLGAGNLNYT